MRALSSALALSLLLLQGSGPIAAAAGPGGDLSVDHFGARGDGETDDTAAIQAGVDALRAPGTLRFPPGTYKINSEKGLQLHDGTRLDLGTATLVAPNVNGARCRILEIEGGKGISILGGTLVGSRAGAPQWGVGILASDAEDLVIEGVTFRDFYFDGVLLTGNVGCRRVTVRQCLSENNRRTGLAIPAATGVVVEESVFQGSHGQSPEAGVNCEPGPGASVVDVRFRACRFSNNAGAGLYVHKALGIAAREASATDCTFENNAFGIIAGGVEGVTLTGNHLRGHRGRGKSAIAIGDGTSRASVTGNDISEGFRGIMSAGATDVEIRDNTIEGDGARSTPGAGDDGDGIVCRGLHSLLADACAVIHNDVRRCAGSGIVGLLVSRIRVLDNTVAETGQRGIYLSSVTGSEVTGNQITAAGSEAPGRYSALELGQSANDNLVANNVCRLGAATREGVSIGSGCRGNNVFGNVVIPWGASQ
jgi:nitrous oxidase accessory protein NosD